MAEAEGVPRLPRWFSPSLALLTLVFFGLGLARANRSTLRGDEMLALTEVWEGQPIGDLLLHGARGQTSPAPALYIADKVSNAAKRPLRYLGLTPPGYFRLPTLIFTAVLLLATGLVLGLRIRGGTPVQFLLLLAGLAVYAFHPKVFSFAGTERPYGLWNGLWLLALASLLGSPPLRHLPLAVLLLLAGTATASCFQLLALGIALVVLRRIQQRPFRETLREGALLLGAPVLVAAYYAIQTRDMKYETREYAEVATNFLRFWLLSNLHVWIAAGALTVLALKRPTLRVLALPPLALAALLLLMPAMFSLAHWRGNSMVSRQYIWTTTAVPLVFFFAAAAWTDLNPGRFLRGVALAAALLVPAGVATATFLRPERRNDSLELTLLRPDSPLMTLLRTERPRHFSYPLEPFPSEEGPADLTGENVALIDEWIQIRFGALPRSRRRAEVFVVEGRLEARLIE